MRKRILLLSAGVVILVLLVVLAGLYLAARRAPKFYEEALHADPAKQAAASDQMLQQTTALVSNVKNVGRWRMLFTAEQINGWLAVDLVKNHANSIPPGVHDPRVQLRSGEMTLACRYETRGMTSVLSLTVDLYLVEPNVIGLRIKKARAGMLPLPLHKVLTAITQSAHRMDLPLRWTEEDGDPVALITLPPQRGDGNKQLRIENLRLSDGEIYVAGSTESEKAK